MTDDLHGTPENRERFDAGSDAHPTGIVLAQASRDGGRSMPWLVTDRRALPLHECAVNRPLGRVGSLTELVEHWPNHEADLRSLTSHPQVRAVIHSRGVDNGSLRLEAPIQPRQAFCTIGNYRGQIAEAAADTGDGGMGAGAAGRRAAALEALDHRSRTGEPYVCLTSPERVGPPVGDLTIAPGVETLDWEVEIAVVIGASTHRVSPTTAPGVVAGFCVANDLTIRSRVMRDDLPTLGTDWIQSKGMPGSLPLGPWFVPAWQVPHPSRLRLQLSVNDTVMQDDTADDMVFDVDRQIAYVSRHTRLRPGDVLCTGSPAGFGAHHGRFLRPGDVVVAQVTGLGAQRLRCVAEQTTPGREPTSPHRTEQELMG